MSRADGDQSLCPSRYLWHWTRRPDNVHCLWNLGPGTKEGRGGKIPSLARVIPMHRRSLRTPERFRSAAHRLPATPGLVHYWKSFSFSHKSPGPEPRALLFSPCQGEGLCFMSHCVLNTRRNLGKWLAQSDEMRYFIFNFIIVIVIIIVNFFFLCENEEEDTKICRCPHAFCTS